MAKAIRFHKVGGPEVLVWEEVPVGDPAPGEVRIRHHAIGLNFIDTYHRSGLYPVSLPSGIGMEGAGVVEAVGPEVTDFQPGDRVAYASRPIGSYAEERLFPADRLIKLPETIPFEIAAAMMLKGMTVRYLIKRTFKVEPGMTVLWHAAAGGVGLIACQWLRALGVTVIGTVSSEAKAEVARAQGCTHPVVSTRESFLRRVMEITNRQGVPVVYDAVGKDVFADSLNCLSRFGMYVNFGNASGVVPPIDPLWLSQKGSLYLSRPTLTDYIARREDLVATARDLFGIVASGKLKIGINQRYPLASAAQAHRDLEARKTTGSTVLMP